MPVTRSSRVLAAVVVAIAASIGATPAVADATFYQGKQGRLFTMGSPGGGYDTYTRTVSAFLEKRIGVKLIPTNETAAGGMIAMNRMINAPPDGLTLLLTGGEGLVTAQLYGLSGVNYDVRKQIFLARVSGEDKVVTVGGPSPIKTVSDLATLDRQALWAGSGKADNNSDFSAIMCYALGAKCKIILGYKGTGGMNIAIQRGEVDGRVISDESAALYGPELRHAGGHDPGAPALGELPERADDLRGGETQPHRHTAARLARRHREPRACHPDHARHAEGARRLSARRACQGPAGSGLRSPR